MTVEGTS